MSSITEVVSSSNRLIASTIEVKDIATVTSDEVTKVEVRNRLRKETHAGIKLLINLLSHLKLAIAHQLSFSYPLSSTTPPARSTSSSSSPFLYK